MNQAVAAAARPMITASMRRPHRSTHEPRADRASGGEAGTGAGAAGEETEDTETTFELGPRFTIAP
ncbi:hypothetical protein [Antribacter gilvus]|uniref:hypothetical protein n=1 Tax=Antribacter gilvus TaxID=2304675 RepID=UPI000F7A903E|nr:hypothetical protein [Antribacter gilvus]